MTDAVGYLRATTPGSWKADLVRQLIGGTAGPDGDHLPQYRTELVVVDVEEVTGDPGIDEEHDWIARQA